MRTVDWRELIASNKAVIDRATRASPRTGRPVRIHVPAGLDPATAAPLVLMLHGCTQDAERFAAATRMDAVADRHGFVVAYPEQHRGANPQGCWNWFEPSHQARDGGEPAALAAVAADLAAGGAPCRIDARRVFVAGMSAGGAMAAVLAATHPDVFAAVAVHSGLAYRSATSMGEAFAAMARGAPDPVRRGAEVRAAMGARARVVPSLVVHGDADRTVAPVNGMQALEAAMAVNRLAGPRAADLDPRRPSVTAHGRPDGGYAYVLRAWNDDGGVPVHAHLAVEGLGHAWSGGAPGGSFADPRGPDAGEAIWRFFAAACPSAGQVAGNRA
jgi:poly(hydroxyalkanoate) depolymerase family esterase